MKVTFCNRFDFFLKNSFYLSHRYRRDLRKLQFTKIVIDAGAAAKSMISISIFKLETNYLEKNKCPCQSCILAKLLIIYKWNGGNWNFSFVYHHKKKFKRHRTKFKFTYTWFFWTWIHIQTELLVNTCTQNFCLNYVVDFYLIIVQKHWVKHFSFLLSQRTKSVCVKIDPAKTAIFQFLIEPFLLADNIPIFLYPNFVPSLTFHLVR